MTRGLEVAPAASARIRMIGSSAIALLLAASPAPAQEKGEGPTTLFLTYKCEPAKRAAFRAHMAGPGVAQFEKWKKEGVYKEYLVLFSSYVNRRELDMLVRLDFANYVDTEKWKAVERTMPGGLSADALLLCAPEQAYLADLMSEGKSPTRDPDRAVYLYIPYQFEKDIGKPEYKKYFETYVKPQNEAWIAEKALWGWAVYLNQDTAGPPWDALILYEYAGPAGLAQRDAIKGGVRARLRNDPAWKAVSESKASIRTEEQVIVMDPIIPR
jgi:hypothetical protein